MTMMKTLAVSVARPFADDESLLRELRRLLKVAETLNDNEQFQQTISTCSTAIEIINQNRYCKDPPALHKVTLDIYFARAIGHLRCGHHELATEDLSRVLTMDPEYDTAHAYRASELADMGLHTLALADYTEAIRLNCHDPANYFNRAQCHLKLNSPQVAARDLTVYLAFHPDDPEALQIRGEVYAKLKKWKKAKVDLTKCLELDPQNDSTAALLRTVQKALKSHVPSSPTAKGGRPRTLNTTRLTSLAESSSTGGGQRADSPAAPTVRFHRVFVREHARELGASGGVPQKQGDGYALGISDEHVDFKPVHIQVRATTNSDYLVANVCTRLAPPTLTGIVALFVCF